MMSVLKKNCSFESTLGSEHKMFQIMRCPSSIFSSAASLYRYTAWVCFHKWSHVVVCVHSCQLRSKAFKNHERKNQGWEQILPYFQSCNGVFDVYMISVSYCTLGEVAMDGPEEGRPPKIPQLLLLSRGTTQPWCKGWPDPHKAV